MRKRKRPKYLNDFVQNSNDTEDSIIESKSTKKQKVAADGKFQSEHEENDFEEKLVESEAGQCCLCDEKLTARSTDIQTSTGSSEASYATILNSVFKADSEQNFTSEKIPPLRFSTGEICLYCKAPIQNLDLFQNKAIGLKKVLLNRISKKLKGTSANTNDEKWNTEIDEENETVADAAKKEGETSLNSKIKKTVRSTPAVKKELTQEPGQSGGRPRREKPVTPMSEIERAKIKNLNSDLKFKVNKHSKTDVYIIEYLKEKKGNSFLVKWENRHETENSWEVRRKIPASVLQVNLFDFKCLSDDVFPLSITRRT